MKQEKFSLKARISSFGHALNGLKTLIIQEHNARIHVVSAVVVALAGMYFDLSNPEWFAILLCISMVLALEAVNSAIENIADSISTEHNPTIGKAKDLAAGAVLIGAFFAGCVSTIVFLPKILNSLNSL